MGYHNTIMKGVSRKQALNARDAANSIGLHFGITGTVNDALCDIVLPNDVSQTIRELIMIFLAGRFHNLDGPVKPKKPNLRRIR